MILWRPLKVRPENLAFGGRLRFHSPKYNIQETPGTYQECPVT